MAVATPDGFTFSRRESGDRFIPCRRKLNFAGVHTPKVERTESDAVDTLGNLQSPAQRTLARNYRKMIGEALQQDSRRRVLSFSNSPSPGSPRPGPRMEVHSPYRQMPPTTWRQLQLASTKYERILALPDLVDDFYSNPIDWSSNGLVVVAMDKTIHAWDAETDMKGIVGEEKDVENEDQRYLSSVKWSADSQHLAAGWSNGIVELWNVGEEHALMNSVEASEKQVGCIDWKDQVLYCGSKGGSVHVLDPRTALKSIVTMTPERKSAVTSLHVSPDKTMLATGYRNGLVRLWCTRSHKLLHEMHAHYSAVKGLSWCPWKYGMLASASGGADSRITMWNRHGREVFQQNTASPTCALIWSPEYKELVSSHGKPNNEMTVWSVKDAEMTRQGSLVSHLGRTLHMALSPDRTAVVSVAADETLRLWHLFPPRKPPAQERSPVQLFGLR